MTCGNHNTTVKLIYSCHISYRRCCCNMKQVCICTGCYQSTDQCIFKHIAGTSCILTNYNSSRSVIPILSFQFSIIPAEKTPNLVCVICCQVPISFPTETISSKILTHRSKILSTLVYYIWRPADPDLIIISFSNSLVLPIILSIIA